MAGVTRYYSYISEVYANENEIMNVVMRKNEDLSVEEAVEILTSSNTPTIAVPPTLPKLERCLFIKLTREQVLVSYQYCFKGLFLGIDLG